MPKRITQDDIKGALSYFEGHEYYKQIRAIILQGASSGIRAEELYQLTLDDIDLEHRTVYINHNPSNGQTTKTKQSRVSFFSEEAKDALVEYVTFYNRSRLSCLFNQCHIERIFRDAPFRVKDLRKAFSQEWTRRNGDTGVKKIIMGHSLRDDVDLTHYNYQSEEDLKKIYDKVMKSE